MIEYDQRTFAGFYVLVQCAGSVYNRRVMIPSCLSCFLLITKKVAAEFFYDVGHAFNHPFPYQFFAFLLGFIIVFRTNLTYSRFWQGRTAIELMSSKWSDVALQSLVFDAPTAISSLEDRAHCNFMRQLLSSLSLLHAVSLASLGDGMNELQILDGLNQQQVLTAMNRAQSVNQEVAVALQWVQVLLTERMKSGGLKMDPPILSRVFQELSTGHLGYRNAQRIHHTPFPFPYVQLISTSLFFLVPLSAMMMDKYIVTWYWSVSFCFISVSAFFAVNEVAIELEDPFGSDTNDLPMEAYQREFNERLLMLSHAYSPEFRSPGFDPRYSIRGKTMSIKADKRLLVGAGIRLPTQPEPCTLHWIETPHHPKVVRAENLEDEEMVEVLSKQDLFEKVQYEQSNSSSYMTMSQVMSHHAPCLRATTSLLTPQAIGRRLSTRAPAPNHSVTSDATSNPTPRALSNLGCGTAACDSNSELSVTEDLESLTELTPNTESTCSVSSASDVVPERPNLLRIQTTRNPACSPAGARLRLEPLGRHVGQVLSQSSPLTVSPTTSPGSPVCVSTPAGKYSVEAVPDEVAAAPVSMGWFSGERPVGGYPASWFAGGTNSRLLSTVRSKFLKMSNSQEQVSELQLGQLVEQLGIQYSQSRQRKLMKRLDRDNTGSVSFEAFYHWLLQRDQKKRRSKHPVSMMEESINPLVQMQLATDHPK